MKIKLLVLLLFTVTFSISQPTWQWAKSFGGKMNDAGTDIAADASGNVYTMGTFEDTVDFDPGTGVFNMIADPAHGSVYLTKLDAQGNFVWAKQWSKDLYNAPYTVNINNNGEVFFSGHYTGLFDADPGAGVSNLPYVGDTRYFLIKLSSSGNFIWAKTFGGVYNTPLSFTTFDASGNIYIAGFFSYTYDFDPGPAVYNMTAAYRDIFILRLDPSGNFVWAKQTTGSLNTWVDDITLDSSGNILIAGTFSGTTDFDPGSAQFNLTAGTTIPDEDVYILKLSNSGTFLWAKSFIANNLNYCWSIVTDQADNIYTTGNYTGTVDFDPGPGIYNLSAGGCYISKLSAAGNFIFAKALIGSGAFVFGRSLALDNSSNLYLTGGYNDTVDFDPGPNIYNLTSDSIGFASFVASYDSSGDLLWAQSKGGIFHFGGQMNSGLSVYADGSNNIYFTGRFEDPQISFGNSTLLNATPDTLAFTDAFVAKIGGSSTGINENDHDIAFTVYPNPTNGFFTINASEPLLAVKIYDVLGNIILAKQLNSLTISSFNLSNQSRGLYFYEVQLKDGTFHTGKILVE